MFCVSCGEPLKNARDTCAACGAAAVGARFSEQVIVRDGARVRVPWVCCCCLGPNDGTDEQTFTGSSLTGGRRYTMRVDIPWCDQCRATRGFIGWAGVGVGVGVLLVVWLAVGRVVDGATGFAAGLVSSLVGYIVVAGFLPRLMPSLRAPGHVPGCQAVSGTADRSEARITFANRGFARIWRELAAGVECRAPALLWNKPALAGRPVEAPKTAVSTEASGKLAVQALRQHAREAAKVAPIGGRRGAASGPAPAGADAIAGLLRFTVKECRFVDTGIEARLSSGVELRVAWTDIARVCARQLPPAAPFGGAVILDLVLDAPAGEAPGVLRLIASTRANFAALPGSGLTSQENFRRLAAHVKATHPGVELEPASEAFFSQGKAPPRFDALVRFEEYDAHYR